MNFKMLRLAVKNLLRYRKRTSITSLVIGYGVMLYVLIASLLGFMEESSERTYIWYETSAAKIYSPGHYPERDFHPLDYSFDPSEVGADLDAEQLNWTPRINVTGELVVNGIDFDTEGSLPAVITGIDIERDETTFRLKDDLDTNNGRWLEPGKPQVLLGEWLAKDLGGDVGDIMTLTMRTKTGFQQALDVEIVGIIVSEDGQINTTGIFIPIDYMDEMLVMDGTVTEINIEGFDLAKVSENYEKAKKVAVENGLEGYFWKEIATSYVALQGSKKASSYVLLLIIAVMAAIGIINTLLMAIFERVREIGMLMAIGMSKIQMQRLFTIEATMIGILGAIIGIVLGGLLNWLLVRFGLDYGFFLDRIKDVDIGYRISSQVFGVWRTNIFLEPAIFAIILSFFIGWGASARIKKMRIIECLNHH